MDGVFTTVGEKAKREATNLNMNILQISSYACEQGKWHFELEQVGKAWQVQKEEQNVMTCRAWVTEYIYIFIVLLMPGDCLRLQ